MDCSGYGNVGKKGVIRFGRFGLGKPNLFYQTFLFLDINGLRERFGRFGLKVKTHQTLVKLLKTTVVW